MLIKEKTHKKTDKESIAIRLGKKRLTGIGGKHCLCVLWPVYKYMWVLHIQFRCLHGLYESGFIQSNTKLSGQAKETVLFKKGENPKVQTLETSIHCVLTILL